MEIFDKESGKFNMRIYRTKESLLDDGVAQQVAEALLRAYLFEENKSYDLAEFFPDGCDDPVFERAFWQTIAMPFVRLTSAGFELCSAHLETACLVAGLYTEETKHFCPPGVELLCLTDMGEAMLNNNSVEDVAEYLLAEMDATSFQRADA